MGGTEADATVIKWPEFLNLAAFLYSERACEVGCCTLSTVVLGHSAETFYLQGGRVSSVENLQTGNPKSFLFQLYHATAAAVDSGVLQAAALLPLEPRGVPCIWCRSVWSWRSSLPIVLPSVQGSQFRHRALFVQLRYLSLLSIY